MVATDDGVGGELGVGDGGADAQAAVVGLRDAVVTDPRDVDQVAGTLDAEAHQIDEVRAPREVAHAVAGVCLGRRHRAGRVARALVGEGPQIAACSIAAMIPG